MSGNSITLPRRSAEHGFTPSRRSAEHGFTLIELLVAMVAGSFVLAALSWSLASLGRELDVSRQAEPRHRLDAASPLLAGLIEQARPVLREDPPIVAEPRRMAFLTAPPAALGAVGQVRAILSVRAGEGGDALYARFEPAEADATLPGIARADQALLEKYRSIRFDYLLADKKDEGMPPRLVTISLTDGDGRLTRIAAAPRLTSGGDCRFDPVSMTCRR